MKKQKKSTYDSKKILVVIVVATLVVAIAWFFITRNSQPPSGQATNGQNQPGTEKLDMSPATDKDKKDAESTKDTIIKKDEQTAQPQTGSKTVTPTIIDAGQYDQSIEVRAFIGSVYEDGGTCVFTFKSSSQTITKSSPGLKDATTTRCTNISVPKSEFSNGSWSVVVSYSSTTASGSSTAKVFEVK